MHVTMQNNHCVQYGGRGPSKDRLYEAVVQSVSDAIITKTLDGRITGWNRAAERLFGFSADEAIGQPIGIIVPPGGRRRNRPSPRTQRRGRVHRTFRHGSAHQGRPNLRCVFEHFPDPRAIRRKHRRGQDHPRHHGAEVHRAQVRACGRGLPERHPDDRCVANDLARERRTGMPNSVTTGPN
jgi:PAS domain-containing protein